MWLATKWQWPVQGIELVGECRAVVEILGEGGIKRQRGIYSRLNVSSALTRHQIPDIKFFSCLSQPSVHSVIFVHHVEPRPFSALLVANPQFPSPKDDLSGLVKIKQTFWCLKIRTASLIRPSNR
ncbi:hypothetical protein J6590_042169 [Homalodisca vitripennis]|nr:hypothetical protein J6590_042169 [Homalodisca vitripennis]